MQTVKAIVAFLFIQSRTRDRYVSTLRMRQLFAVVAPPDSSYVLSVDHPMNVEEKLRALLGQERVAGGDSRSPAASSPTSTAVDAISTDTAAIDNTECPITDAYTEPIRWQGEAQHFPLKAYHQSPEQLLRNLQRYIRFATASYGHRFMQVLGVANYDVPTGSGPYIDADGRTHPFDHVIFSRHVGLPLEAVLDSTANTEPHLTSRASLHLRPLVLHVPNYYLAVDHASKTIIVTIRGTLGLSDMLTNLSCEYTSIWVNGAACQVHAGMFAQARALARPHGRLHNVVKKALLQWADHGLVICGHSMGGGVASLLGLLWSSLKVEDDDNGTMDAAPGSPSGSAYPVGTFLTSRSSKLPANRPVHVYSYGTPCVASLSLSTSLKGLVTSVIHGRDFTYSLCLGIFHDMRQAIVNLSDPHAPVSDQVLKKAMGLTVATSKPTANADTNESLHMTPTRAFSPSFGFPDVVASERDEGTNDDQDYVVVVDADHLSAMGKSDDDDLGSALSTDNDAPIDAKSSIPEYSTDDDWFWSLRTSLQADMQHDKLYAPGDIYWLRAESEGASSVESAVPPLSLLARSHKVAMVLVDVEELFPAVLLSRSALLDHLPTRYEWCLDTLAAEHLDRGDKSASNLSSVINQ